MYCTPKVGSKHLRMLVHCNGRKFMVVVPVAATVLHCKAEILRVYTAINGASDVERICELQDSNQFTLFDEYEIGLLLGDMSEVFATAGLCQERCPYSSVGSKSQWTENALVQVSSTSKKPTVSSDPESASSCTASVTWTPATRIEAEIPHLGAESSPVARPGLGAKTPPIPSDENSEAGNQDAKMSSLDGQNPEADSQEAEMSDLGIVTSPKPGGENSEAGSQDAEMSGLGGKIPSPERVTPAIICRTVDGSPCSDAGIGGGGSVLTSHEAGSCARTLPWSGGKSSSRVGSSTALKRKRRKKGSKKRNISLQVHVEEPSEKSFSEEVLARDSETTLDKSPSEEVSRAHSEEVPALRKTPIDKSSSEEASRAHSEEVPALRKTPVDKSSSEEVSRAHSEEVPAPGPMRKTPVEVSLSEEAATEFVEDSQTSLKEELSEEMFCSETVDKEDKESVISDSCLSYVSPRRQIPRELSSSGSGGSDDDRTSPVIGLQHEQITKEVQKKLWLNSGGNDPSSSSDTSDDSSLDGKPPEQGSKPPLSLDTSKGGCRKQLTTSMFTPTSGGVQPGRSRKQYSLLNMRTTSSKVPAAKSSRKKRMSLSKAEESMAANITPANISTLLANEDLW